MRNMRRDRQLYEAARRHFGTWKKALKAAGIDLDHAFARSLRKLSQQEILDTIKDRQATNASLIWTDIRRGEGRVDFVSVATRRSARPPDLV
jgi:hypothetical protein